MLFSYKGVIHRLMRNAFCLYRKYRGNSLYDKTDVQFAEMRIYYSESENPAYNTVVTTLRRSPFRNYVKREPPREEEVVYFMILEQKDKVEQFFRVLTEQGWERELKIIKYDSDQYPGYEYMKIYNKNATPFSA